MAKIAVLIDDGFEDSQYAEPAQAFFSAGNELIHVGLEEGKEVKGKSGEAKVKIDIPLDKTSDADFNALFIPGGKSFDLLQSSPEALSFTKKFMDENKPLFAICQGVGLLISANALEGRKVTGLKSIAQDLKDAGADYQDEEVVVDDNLVTSRQPGDIPAFIDACLEKLTG